MSLNNQVSGKSCVVHNFSPLLCKAANSILQCKEMFGMIIKLYLLFCGSTKRCTILKESIQITPEHTFRSSLVSKSWQSAMYYCLTSTGIWEFRKLPEQMGDSVAEWDKSTNQTEKKVADLRWIATCCLFISHVFWEKNSLIRIKYLLFLISNFCCALGSQRIQR